MAEYVIWGPCGMGNTGENEGAWLQALSEALPGVSTGTGCRAHPVGVWSRSRPAHVPLCLLPGQVFRGNGPLARPPALRVGLQDRPRRIHLRLRGCRSGFLYRECSQNLSAVSLRPLPSPFPLLVTLLHSRLRLASVAIRAGWPLRTQSRPALSSQQQEDQGQGATPREASPGTEPGLRPTGAAASSAWVRCSPDPHGHVGTSPNPSHPYC